MKLNIALLSGGDSSEREISINSAGQIAQNLDIQKYNVFQIDVHDTDWSYVLEGGERAQVDKSDFSITLGGQKHKFDYALIIIHGTPGEDGKMQGYLDIMRVPYSSCGMVSSVVTFDKTLCKSAVRPYGVNLAKEILLRRGEMLDPERVEKELGLPVFVKPNASGSSFGVSKVKNLDELDKAVELAFSESDAVLIEEFIEGREFGCGLMLTGEKEYIFPVAEIISEREFFDYTAKYEGKSEEIVPAQISDELSDSIKTQAVKAYRACNCRGIVRIDFIVKNSEPYMVEINSIPGMSSESIIPKQLRAAGISVGEIYDEIISNSLK
ncbi:MAG: D-alanine--D-alanine ligase [Rikenellaceae bacterium]